MALGQRYFCITYDTKKKKYILKDMEDGSGTFIKIMFKQALRAHNLISFGDSLFTVDLRPTYKVGEKGEDLIIEFIVGPKAEKV